MRVTRNRSPHPACAVPIKMQKYSKGRVCVTRAAFKVDGVNMCSIHAGRAALKYLMEKK